MKTTAPAPQRDRTTSKKTAPNQPTPDLLALYEQMMLLRRFELAVQENYKKGLLPGFLHLYIGEEAVATGVCAHLRREDWITSTHRGHGHSLAKGVSPDAVMAELFGRAGGCNGGRGGSMHLYERDEGLFGTNGLVGGGIPSAVGIGVSARQRGTENLGVAFFGDGALNHGTFHESINLAAVLNAPTIFICENNLYATATPITSAMKNTDVTARGMAYGVPSVSVDGNDVEAVWQAAREAVERARSGGGPSFIEARTYRTVGHHEGDQLTGTYRTQQELDEWKERDPILRLRHRLVESGDTKLEDLDAIDERVKARINQSVAFATASPWPEAATAIEHVWAEPVNPPEVLASKPGAETTEQSWLDAVRDGIAEEMRHDPNILYFGEGTGERGGSFGHTKGLWAEFGAGRMIDTPISELGFTGAAVGAAASGCRAVSDLMFADFIFEAASQIIQQAAKLRYVTVGRLGVPLVVRAGAGAIKNAGPHHSGSYHPLWAHCSGLLVVVPSNPADAKGLWKTALRTGDPVIMLEHKSLFASKGPVPKGEYFVPFGQAAVVRQGSDITLVSCALMLHRCLEAAVELEKAGVSAEVIDLRTIVPLDVETVAASVARTGRLLIVDEAFSMCGIGGELSAAMMELAFDELDAPIGRLHTETTAHPFAPTLENAVTIDVQKIIAAARGVIAGKAPRQRRVRTGIVRNDVTAAHLNGMAQNAATTDAAPAGAIDQMEKSLSDMVVENVAVAPEPVEAGSDTPVDGTPIKMPNVDLTITEATIVKWLKSEGDAVQTGDIILEAESSKAVYEVEAPADGTIGPILAPAGTVVKIGQVLGAVRPQ